MHLDPSSPGGDVCSAAGRLGRVGAKIAVQGAVSGVALALGYGIGAGGSSLWHYLQIPTLSGRARRVVLAVLVGVIVLAVVLAQWRFVGWQNDQRRLFGMQPISPAAWPVLAAVTLLVATLLLVVGRVLRLLFRTTIRRFRRRLPERLANVLGVAVALLLVWGLVSGVLVRGFWAGANAMFAPQDLVSKSGVEQAPTSALRTGGPGSTISWDSLGREGRSFVVLGPTVDDLQQSSPGSPVKEPIRVYAGLDSADTVQARADVVLRELQRTGAFSRTVLVLATTTGSGFIQPGGIDPVEYLWHGDTAVAGVQYSYLPSWLSLLADQANVQQASQSVFQTVYRYWSTLPADTRPRLYLYGLSLGSFGVQSVLTNIVLLNQPISGALMVGPPFVNELHQRLTAQRDARSTRPGRRCASPGSSRCWRPTPWARGGRRGWPTCSTGQTRWCGSRPACSCAHRCGCSPVSGHRTSRRGWSGTRRSPASRCCSTWPAPGECPGVTGTCTNPARAATGGPR